MITTSVYKMAVFYVETCKWSVIPLRPNSKIPLIDWKEYQTRFPTQEELQSWFLNTENNIGIVTGSLSNLSVVDVDVLTPLELLKTVKTSTIALTQRGRHLYFQYSGETNSASKIADKIDVRGEGGFVVAPGSIVDGFKYRFLSPIVDHTRLSSFPRGLLDNVTEQGKFKPRNQQGWIAKAVATIEEGGQRTPNFVKLIGRYHYDGHLPSDILAILTPLANSSNYSLEKLQNAINDITKKEGKRSFASNQEYSAGDKTENIEKFLEGEEKVEWIVPQLIARSSIGFMPGLPESYKTWLLIDLALECTKVHGEWLGNKVNQTRVLFIDQERWSGETRRRFKKMMVGKGMEMNEDLKHYLHIQVGSTIRLNVDESFNAFRRKLQEIQPELIIIDSFATISTVAENDRTEVQKVLERIKQIRQEFNCSVLLIDHETKSVLNPELQGTAPTAFTMVGSVAKPAAAETVLTVRKDKADSVTVFHTKSTLAPTMSPISLQVQDTDNGGIKLVLL